MPICCKSLIGLYTEFYPYAAEIVRGDFKDSDLLVYRKRMSPDVVTNDIDEVIKQFTLKVADDTECRNKELQYRMKEHAMMNLKESWEFFKLVNIITGGAEKLLNDDNYNNYKMESESDIDG